MLSPQFAKAPPSGSLCREGANGILALSPPPGSGHPSNPTGGDEVFRGCHRLASRDLAERAYGYAFSGALPIHAHPLVTTSLFDTMHPRLYVCDLTFGVDVVTIPCPLCNAVGFSHVRTPAQCGEHPGAPRRGVCQEQRLVCQGVRLCVLHCNVTAQQRFCVVNSLGSHATCTDPGFLGALPACVRYTR